MEVSEKTATVKEIRLVASYLVTAQCPVCGNEDTLKIDESYSDGFKYTCTDCKTLVRCLIEIHSE